MNYTSVEKNYQWHVQNAKDECACVTNGCTCDKYGYETVIYGYDDNGNPQKVTKVTKKPKKPLNELVKFVTTTDDWHPNIHGNCVKVRLIDMGPKSGGKWRVLVKGGDDFGREKDFPSREDALPVYDMIKDGISVAELEDEGFDPH